MTQNLSFSASFCRVDITSYSPEDWSARFQRCSVALASLGQVAPGRKIYYYWPDGKFYESNVGIGAVCERWMGSWLGSYVSSAEEALYRRAWQLSIIDTTDAILHVKKEISSVLAIAQRWSNEGIAVEPSIRDNIAWMRDQLSTTQGDLEKLRATYQKNTGKHQEMEEVIRDFCKVLIKQAAEVLVSPEKKEPEPVPVPPEEKKPEKKQRAIPSVKRLKAISADQITAMQNINMSEIQGEAEQIQAELYLKKKRKSQPWTIAVVKGGQSYFHLHTRLVPVGEGGKYKIDKRAYCLAKGEVAKLSTKMCEGNTIAKIEEGYLKRLMKKNLPNVVETYDIVYRGNKQIIYQKYYVNTSLFFAFERLKFDPLQLKKIIVGILKGLAALHEEGIVHRDIKPENIFLDEQDNPYIGDFGLSSDIDSDGDGKGSPYYLAPEQAYWVTIHTSLDIWALGMMVYGLFVGECAVNSKGPWPWLQTAITWENVCYLNRTQKDYDFPKPENVWWHACWEMLQVQPYLRPSAQVLYERLSKQLMLM